MITLKPPSTRDHLWINACLEVASLTGEALSIDTMETIL